MESLATTIRFVTLNCLTLSSELKQTVLSRLLRYLFVPSAALQKTRGCAVAVRNDWNNLVEDFGSRSSRCAFARLRDHKGRQLCSENGVITERTSDNGDCLVELCEQTGLIIASTFERNPLRHQLTWQELFWDVAFDSDHRPVLHSIKIRFYKRNRGVPPQPKIDIAGLKGDECRTNFRQRVFIHAEDAAKETLLVQMPRKKFAPAETRCTTLYVSCKHWRFQPGREGSCVVNCNNIAITSGRRERRSLKSGKMKRCSPVLNTANGKAVDEATLPFWRGHFKALLNRQPPAAPERERVIEIWQRYSKPMQLAFLDFKAAFDSPHRGRFLQDGVPGKFVCLLDDMNQRTSAAVRIPARYTTPHEGPVDIALALLGCLLTDPDDAVIFAENTTKIQHGLKLVSKLAANYELRLCPD
ncbi:hypothetical protein RB195_011243 [Necator americanus]|uniref:Reverse transcriptase domain-containing protein n=1 Tax=Necator americanus TaxID=51031 RepID=A0ABR1D3R6_NECAM